METTMLDWSRQIQVSFQKEYRRCHSRDKTGYACYVIRHLNLKILYCTLHYYGPGLLNLFMVNSHHRASSLQARNEVRTNPEPILYLFRAEPILNQFWTNFDLFGHRSAESKLPAGFWVQVLILIILIFFRGGNLDTIGDKACQNKYEV